MVPVRSFNRTIGQLSIKAVLKKTLFEKAKFSLNSPLNIPNNFPLTTVSSDVSLIYRSAIAFKLAASRSSEASNIAHQLVEVITRETVPQDCLESKIGLAIFDNCLIQTNHQGWVTLTLSDQGITTWLQYLNDVRLDLPQEHRQQAIPSLPDFQGNFPLCSKLRLSLPMLLQFGHVRCCAWLRQAETLCNEAREEPAVILSGELQTRQSAWAWSSRSPKVGHSLLQAIAQALDTMADQSGDYVTCLRQGYLLAEAIYGFQAAIPSQTVHALPSEVQVSIWSVTRAAQQVLALILSGVLEQTPAKSF